MIFRTIKDDIMEVLEQSLGSFRSEMVALIRVHSLTFREFRACGAPEYFREKDPIMSRHWLEDVANAFRTGSCPDRARVSLVGF